MSAGRWTLLIVVLLITGLLALFVVQNLGRTTDLSLDLWFGAWHLSRPVPVPTLLLGTFLAGLCTSGAWALVSHMGASRRIDLLEQDLARASLGRRSASTAGGSSGGGSDDPWG